MFTINLAKGNKFRINSRLFVSVCDPVIAEAQDGDPSRRKWEKVAKLKTVIDKNKNIKRVSDTGAAWESVIGLEIHAQINAKTKESCTF